MTDQTKKNTMTESDDLMSFDIRLKLVELTGQLGEQEADRAWKRYGSILTLNAGLLLMASYSLSNKLHLFTVLISLFGVFLSVLSYRIMTFSQFFEERWRLDMKELINGNVILKKSLRSRSILGPRSKRPFKGSSTGDSKVIIIGMLFFWTSLGIISVLSEFFPETQIVKMFFNK